MLAFEIYVNGKRLCTAGLGEPGVMSAIMNWLGSEPRKDSQKRGPALEEFVSLRVGGLVSHTEKHVTWLSRRLKAGDEVSILLVETERADRPRKRDQEMAAKIRSRQKRQVRILAKEFGWKIQTKKKAAKK